MNSFFWSGHKNPTTKQLVTSISDLLLWYQGAHPAWPDSITVYRVNDWGRRMACSTFWHDVFVSKIHTGDPYYPWQVSKRSFDKPSWYRKCIYDFASGHTQLADCGLDTPMHLERLENLRCLSPGQPAECFLSNWPVQRSTRLLYIAWYILKE